MEQLVQDVRLAFRTLRRAPGFTAAALLSLALGIGANSAIFTVMDAALLRSLPVDQPDELVQLSTNREGQITPNFSHPIYSAIRDGVRSFEGVLAHSPIELTVRTAQAAEQLTGAVVTGNFFQVLGARVEHGRPLHPADDQAGAPLAVVINHDLWQRHFAGGQDAIGQRLTMNGQPVTIVGVAAAGFNGLVRGAREQFWLPISAQAALVPGYDAADWLGPRYTWLDVFARLADGVTVQTARAELATVDAALRSAGLFPTGYRNVVEPAPGGIGTTVEEFRVPLVYLTGAVALVLLIACANVANLLLARSAGRRRELAIRSAVGGGRARLARQLLIESLLLSLLAGSAGLLLSVWVSDALANYRPSVGTELVLDIAPDARILGFTLLISLATGLLFGIEPAIRAARSNPLPLLKQGGERGSRTATRDVLVVLQVALSLVLLVGAGVMVRSIRSLDRIDLGYTTRNALLADFNLESLGYDRDRNQALVQSLLERIRMLPGVIDATIAGTITPSPAGSRWDGMQLDGYTPAENEVVGFDLNVVDDHYFSTMGLAIVEGRPFTAQDVPGAPAAVIINQAMARRYWPGQSAIGKRIFLDEARTRWFEVVGVARDGKYRTLREAPENNAWRPLQQQFRPFGTIVVHTRGEPVQMLGALRQAVRAIDPGVPLYAIRTLEQHVELASARERMAGELASGFSLLALALAIVGLYGLLAYFVTQRTREIGIRMALGAHRSNVLRNVLARGMALVTLGVLLGVPGALFATRLLGSIAYGVTTTDAASYTLAALLLVGFGALAAYLPARRATRVDPVTALRLE